MVLSALPGVGERLAKKMTDHFGSEEAALSSLKSGDIGQIAEIDGVSPKRALALARSIAGDNGQFLATCLLYTSPSPRDRTRSRMPSSA